MKLKSILLLIPCLLLASCGQANNNGGTNNDNNNGGDQGGDTGGNTDQGEALEGYYSTINENDSGATLLGKVRDLIVSTHTHYTDYDDNRGPNIDGKVDRTDYDPNNADNILGFYSGISFSNDWDQADTWNREHVWPQSLSNGNWKKDNGGADMHHIRPEITSINGERSNRLFYEQKGQGKPFKYNGKVIAYEGEQIREGTWEPLDNRKGDCARIVFYMFTHYNNPTTLDRYDNLEDSCYSTANSKGSLRGLKFTHVVYAPNDKEALKMLMRWHELDPVDQLEINRNNGVFGIQHNRNAFIDHPEFVEKIWGDIK